jgi:hypothetical protein
MNGQLKSFLVRNRGNVAVGLVLGWAMWNLLALSVSALQGDVLAAQHTATFRLVHLLVAVGVGVAYFIVVRQAPSEFRKGAGGVITILLVAMAVGGSNRTAHVVTASDVLAYLIVSLIVVVPLVCFRLFKPAPQPVK